MYHNIDEFESAMMNLRFAYPSITEVITPPFWTVGGRKFSCLRIGKNTASGADGLLILCGLHAREWVPPEIGINLMADLLPAYANNESLTYGLKTYTAAEIREIVDSINLFIIPCANPDGRLFTQSFDPASPLAEQKFHLQWRTNRNLSNAPAGDPSCHGVDLNRNYDFAFDLPKYFDTVASDILSTTSNNACDFRQTYQGPNAFSEAETQNIRWLLDTYQRIRWCVDIHAHLGQIFYPWGDDQNQTNRPAMSFLNSDFDHQRGKKNDDVREYISKADLAMHEALANRLREGIQSVNQTNYPVKQTFDLYSAPVAATATDWIWSRHLVHPSLPRVEAFAIEVASGESDSPYEFGFQPRPAIKDAIVRDITSGLINFSLATVCGLGITAVPDALTVVFNNIPEGRVASRPVILRVTGCWGATFRVISGPTKTGGAAGIVFGVAVGTGSLPLPPQGTPVTRELFLWLTVQGGAPGQTATGTVRVECPDTNQTWDILLTANFVRAPRAGAVLILDRSGSMSDDAGDGRTRLQVLRESAPAFVDVAAPNTRIGLVRFASDASSGAPMTTMGPEGPDPGGRRVIREAISNHTLASGTAGATSIGDGVYAGTQLIEPESEVDFKSLVVLTDGHENSPQFLKDIASLIHNRVFAIGLGRAQDIQPLALDMVTNKTGGYLLMTGMFDGDDPYRLAKYYLQILTGVTNDQVVVDPDGWLPVGSEQSIPFTLNEADQSVDAIILTPFPEIMQVRLRTPSGEILDQSHPSLKWTEGKQMGFFRFTLPVPGKFSKDGPGGWEMLIGWKRDFRKRWDRLQHKDFFPGTAVSDAIRYKVMVHARSEVAMETMVVQNSHTPGAKVTVRVRLTQFQSVPIQGARARAVIEFPDKPVIQLRLKETSEGVYENHFIAELYGTYSIRISAEGHSLRGFPFTREACRTASTWRGGDDAPPGGTHRGDRFVLDLLKANVIDPEVLKRAGVNVEKLLALFPPEETEEIRNAGIETEAPKPRAVKKRPKRKAPSKTGR